MEEWFLALPIEQRGFFCPCGALAIHLVLDNRVRVGTPQAALDA